MNKKLNNQYFETKAKHKVDYKKKSLTAKKAFINLIITVILIFLFNLLFNYLTKKAEQNKKNDSSAYYGLFEKKFITNII